MPEVVGVVFSGGGTVYRFDPAGLELAWNERVICGTARGREYGRVVEPNHELAQAQLQGPLRKVLRRASPQDEDVRRRQREQARAALQAFKRKQRERGTWVKPFGADPVFDGGRVVISFGADDKTDLREVAQELSQELGFRVELRQVGPREGARSVGGVGLCGPVLCSTRYPSHENPITLRMAKDQELPMNPGRITGLCGRLRCCLAFEHPVYRAFRDRAPAVGRAVDTPEGVGTVRSYRVPTDSLMVRLDGADRDIEIAVADAEDLGRGGAQQRPERPERGDRGGRDGARRQGGRGTAPEQPAPVEPAPDEAPHSEQAPESEPAADTAPRGRSRRGGRRRGGRGEPRE